MHVVNFQRDIELRELRDFGTTVVQQIGSVAVKQPELTSTIQLLFSQVSLHLFSAGPQVSTTLSLHDVGYMVVL